MALFTLNQSFPSSADDFDDFNVTVTSAIVNDSSYQNVTEGLTSASAAGASIVSPIVMFLAGLIGNILALIVLHKTKHEIRSMMFYTLVAALTWNDLVGICLTSPPVLAAYLNNRYMPGLPWLCRFHALAMVTFGLSTPFIVCTMAVERSLALRCSYFYSKYCTPYTARLTVAILWAFVLVFGALPLMGLGSFTLQYPQTWCFLHFRSYVPLDMAYAGAYVVLNLLVIVVMIVCNGLVMSTLCRVRKSRRRLTNAVHAGNCASGGGALLLSSLRQEEGVEEEKESPLPSQQHVLRRRQHRDVELQMIWLLCAITTIFSVCWAPLMMYILYCLQSPHNSSPVFGLVAVRLASLNQTFNPWIYVILRKSLLFRLRRLCRHYGSRLCFPAFLCKTSQVSEPRRRLTGFHHLSPIYLQPQGGGGPIVAPKNGSSSISLTSPKKYVHVGNQLCPSSQFVGLQEPMVPKDRVLQRKKSGGCKGSRSQSSRGKSVTQISPEAWREISGAKTSSVCRDGLKEEEEGAVGEKADPSSIHSSLLFSPHSCSHTVPLVCNVVHEDSVHDVRPSLSLPAEGAYVDFFRHLSPSGIHCLCDVTQVDVSTTSHFPKACGDETLAENVLSAVSEADDHGYSSKISSDSSHTSTPERSRPNPTRLIDELTKRDGKADVTHREEENDNFLNPASCTLQKSRLCSKDLAQINTNDLKEDGFVQNEDGEDTDIVVVSFKEARFRGNRPDWNNSTENTQTDDDSSNLKRSSSNEDTDHTVNFALNERPIRTFNHQTKLNGSLQDNSADFTSGVFDCRDDVDDDDDDIDNDVYDDGLDSGQSRTGEEREELRRGDRSDSSS